MILPSAIVSLALSIKLRLILFSFAHAIISFLFMEAKAGTVTSSASNGVQIVTVIDSDLFTFVPASLSMEIKSPGVTDSLTSYL